MIYTITFNPAIDYVVGVNCLRLGSTNKTAHEKILAGGKGINVSTVLTNLGVENTALGFLAGFTGNAVKQMLDGQGVASSFIFLPKGNSRINVKIKSDEETEINAGGPEIDPVSLKKLYAQLDGLRDGDSLVLAGSIPSSLPDTVYCDIMEYLGGRDIQFTVDATGDLLRNVLKFHPFLIKPNHHELGDLFGKKLSSAEEIVVCAKALQEQGARNVLVSMAGDGAILAAENGKVYSSPAPKGVVINSVGAGDSMVAGFLTGWTRYRDYRKAFYMGVSAGSASAFSENLASACEVEKIYNLLSSK